MKPKKRQKMCYNCEGEVDLEVIVCPFCAADLREEKPEQQRPSYNPISNLKNMNTQQSLYPSKAPKEPEMEEEEVGPTATAALYEEEEPKNIIGPTLLFTLGSQLFLLGLLMFLFSSKGTLILKWDARFWFIYIFASIPLLIFGYKSLSKV